MPLKRSTAYGLIRKRVAALLPIDTWQLGASNYFVFELTAAAGAPPDRPVPAALFHMSWEQGDPHQAVVIALGPEGTHFEVEDLLADGPPVRVPAPAPIPPGAAVGSTPS